MSARPLFGEEHEAFRVSFRRFLDQVAPQHGAWEAAGRVPREVFRDAGAHGFLGMAVPEEFGGGGAEDFRFHMVIGEETQRAGMADLGLGLTLHNDICTPYFLSWATPEQRERWLPGIASGELITAIAMTEPGMGSDLAAMSATAVRDGDHWVVNGSKTFITNGLNADLVITAVKTDPGARHAGISLLVLERGMDGFTRSGPLAKLGLHAQDTAELHFRDVRVPACNLLGQEGAGFAQLVTKLPQERLSIAVAAVAAAEAAVEQTVRHTRERHAFGKPLSALQHTRFRLAELHTEITIARTFVDACALALNTGELSPERAAMAKWWTTELQGRAVDACLQLHGGYGYMTEYPIARAFADARVTRIYGGATEIMKEIVARSMGLDAPRG